MTHGTNLYYETFSNSVQRLNRYRRKKPNRQGLDETCRAHYKTPKVWCFSYDTFLDFVRNLKRFLSKGCFRVARVRTFSVFVDSFIVSFDSLNHLQAFRHLRNLFLRFGTVPFFFRVHPPITLKKFP